MLLSQAQDSYVLLKEIGLEEVSYERGWYSGGHYQTGWRIIGYAMIGGTRIRIQIATASEVYVFANAYEKRES